jgi:hypothetical protein
MTDLHTPQIVLRLESSCDMNPDTLQMSYGLGWLMYDYRGHLLWVHAAPSTVSQLITWCREEVAVVLLTTCISADEPALTKPADACRLPPGLDFALRGHEGVRPDLQAVTRAAGGSGRSLRRCHAGTTNPPLARPGVVQNGRWVERNGSSPLSTTIDTFLPRLNCSRTPRCSFCSTPTAR